MTRRPPSEVHVFRSVTTRRWIVRALTSTERGYRTQADATRAGVRQAKRRRVDLVIHGRNGAWTARQSPTFAAAESRRASLSGDGGQPTRPLVGMQVLTRKAR